ncbi:MAG: rhodanese-like domain-containing protein [Marinagarivorans sp.]|nr:rhodanese-like domain-containing protein [Marinagarivorans sp.]
MSHKRIHPVDLITQKNAHTCIIDVRTQAEVNTEALADCLHIPLHELSPERVKTEIAKSGKNGAQIYLLCQAGRRAEMAADQLKEHIDGELYVIEGGMNAVKQSNIPLQAKGGKTMSLERQVRIVAGALVFIGCVLGTYVHAGFYGLSAFVGAGLVFAGVTDTCMMGMVIAKMPWNR